MQAALQIVKDNGGYQNVATANDVAMSDELLSTSKEEGIDQFLSMFHEHQNYSAGPGSTSELVCSRVNKFVKWGVERNSVLPRIMELMPLREHTKLEIPIKVRQGTVVTVDGPTQFHTHDMSNPILRPTEVEMFGGLSMGKLALQRCPYDPLANAVEYLTESLHVQQDRMLFTAVDAQVEFSPTNFIDLETMLTKGDIRDIIKSILDTRHVPQTIVMTMNDYMDFVLSDRFFRDADDVHKYNAFAQGNVGKILSCDVVLDTTQDIRTRVINNGNMYVFGTPSEVGKWTNRGGPQTISVGPANLHKLAVGIVVHQAFSCTLTNPRTAAKMSFAPGAAPYMS